MLPKGWLKKNYLLVAFILALVFSAFLHFRGLSGVTILDDDESRAFVLQGSGPLIYFICRPVYLLSGRDQASAFYIAALLGFFNIILFYLLCRKLFDKRLSMLSAIIYACYPLRMNYARTLYPAVFIESAFLLALLFLFSGLNTRKSWQGFVFGVSAVAIFFMHYSGYALVIALALAVTGLSLWRKHFSFSREFILGLVAGCFIPLVLIIWFWPGQDYLQQVAQFMGRYKSYMTHTGTLLYFNRAIFQQMLSSWQYIFISLFTAVSCLFVLVSLRVKRNKALVLLLLIFCTALFILQFATFLGAHPLNIRHIVWLVPLYSVCIAQLTFFLLSRRRAFVKITAGVVLALFICLTAYESYQITAETFTLTPIKDWLKANNIPKRQVITSWWMLNRAGEIDGVSLVPTAFQDNGGSFEFGILWPLVFEAYRKGSCKYILTSGISGRFRLGEGDIMLKYVDPVMSWLHPYSKLKRRPFYEPQEVNISLYRLDDVFSDWNISTIQLNAKRE